MNIVCCDLEDYFRLEYLFSLMCTTCEILLYISTILSLKKIEREAFNE